MTSPAHDNFDLNLIRYLIAIVETRSMVNAANTLDVAPSAVSYAVKKLRIHYNDPLFIRGLNGVTPTALALNLYEKFKTIHKTVLRTLDTGLQKEEYRRRVFIRADALTELWVMDRLLTNGIIPDECIIEFQHSVLSAEERSNKLRLQEIDLDIGIGIAGDRNILSHSLFGWRYTLICRQNHKRVGECITKEQFITEPYLGHATRFGTSIVQSNFNEIMTIRSVDPYVTSESPSTLVLNLVNHDFILFIPNIYLSVLKKNLPIREVKCDFLPEIQISNFIHIHKKNNDDPLLKKIINILKDEATV
ncbi:LysR family transcriptional regulator [Enterobacter hormaechei]|uniref:LysR family transcriptional regulator n=1 Tax=Enterobacter hormaechei TaxID=158836 RepID=UPI000796328B|nr:LysR family transcriptional regulator [Enterobacter hormaechei]CZY16002.1 LysR family transcriptional regulator [Enterobacter hormaechei]